MKTVNDYLDIAKKRTGSKSYNQLAGCIGITSSAISQIRNGGTISPDTLTKIGKLSGVKPEEVHAVYNLSRPMSSETKSMWKRLAPYAASVLLITGFSTTSPTLEASSVPSDIHQNVYYVKLARKILRAIFGPFCYELITP